MEYLAEMVLSVESAFELHYLSQKFKFIGIEKFMFAMFSCVIAIMHPIYQNTHNKCAPSCD